MNQYFDTIIVGAGLIGSSAAYHATQIRGITVALIGPDEPKASEEANYHGAWHDEGRVCTPIARDPIWSELAANSFKHFADLKTESGIDFYSSVGCSFFTNKSETFARVIERTNKLGFPLEDLTETKGESFPYIHFAKDVSVAYGKACSGYLNPRKLVEAFQKLAIASNVTKITSVVTKISKQNKVWLVQTTNGTVYKCRNILVSVGAYASFNDLFADVKKDLTPDLELRTQSLVFFEITNQHTLTKLQSMPSMLGSMQNSILDGMYILPPIQYPNGKYYLKIGHGRHFEHVLTTFNQVKEFYQQGPQDQQCLQELRHFMTGLIPDLEDVKYTSGGGITAHTPSRLPYIQTIDEGFTVVLGGNGHAAKSSYEIGRLAIHMAALGQWDSDLDQSKFHVKWTKLT